MDNESGVDRYLRIVGIITVTYVLASVILHCMMPDPSPAPLPFELVAGPFKDHDEIVRYEAWKERERKSTVSTEKTDGT